MFLQVILSLFIQSAFANHQFTLKGDVAQSVYFNLYEKPGIDRQVENNIQVLRVTSVLCVRRSWLEGEVELWEGYKVPQMQTLRRCQLNPQDPLHSMDWIDLGEAKNWEKYQHLHTAVFLEGECTRTEEKMEFGTAGLKTVTTESCVLGALACSSFVNSKGNHRFDCIGKSEKVSPLVPSRSSIAKRAARNQDQGSH